jgi:hypothetical protein
LLNIVVVSAHARRTAAMATCCSRANGTGMGMVGATITTTNSHQFPSNTNNALTPQHSPLLPPSRQDKKKKDVQKSCKKRRAYCLLLNNCMSNARTMGG